MRTESEEREVVEGGGAVLPQTEEARKPDPCTEVGLVVMVMIIDLVMMTVMVKERQTRPLY